uniref:Methionine sulfoxide reductase B1 n=1 Tax=Hippocampus comes TaxID=109280 RepID=A0A3Q2Z5H3_HIPCM
MSFCAFYGREVYKDHFKPGIYACAKCDHHLFSSRSKYEHSSPWPAFTETIHQDSVAKHEERPGAFKVQSPRVCQRRARQRLVSFLNIQQLTEVHP